MDFTEAGQTLKDEDLMILRTLINHLFLKYVLHFTGDLFIMYLNTRDLFISLPCISFHMLKPKTNYQLFNLIIGFVYKYTIANITGSLHVAAYISQSEHVVKQPPE